MTRVPLDMESLTFSAMSPQHTTLKKLVRSSHSFVWRFCHRRLTAMPSRVRLARRGVADLGSRVRFPTTVIVLSAIPWSPLHRFHFELARRNGSLEAVRLESVLVVGVAWSGVSAAGVPASLP